MCLSFTIVAGSRQRRHSWVRVPRDSWQYFTISDIDFPNLEGQVPVLIFPRKRTAQLYPQALGGPNIKHRFQQFCSVATHVRCRGKFYRPFLSKRRLFWLYYPILSSAMSQFHVQFHMLLITIYCRLSRTAFSYIKHAAIVLLCYSG
jgi:hypothetical protein